ncbi:GGDEF domain-containing protein [Sphingomonas sp.]|uniref:GGDEF domain-containing protein n=1 Tax=Sphingomonas sp. TaxID=28214 RepID=UPI002BAD32DF|nr:GGDEF domain-containing protein [Sphingomonas sp.]HTG39323.1 GGDEF domain-containing protein [Sphingomonas sp.]
MFQRIGEFLATQRIDPTPANYAIAYAVVSNAQSELAIEVAARTDGGVRLTQRDFDELGVQIQRGQIAGAVDGGVGADVLAARAQAQMDGFTDVVVRMHTQARDFGRDLIASADAIERSRMAQGSSPPFIEDVSRITGAMIARVREAERRLEDAHREAEELRRALETARGDALSDPLTGLPNRRALEEAYGERISAGRTPCVAICDVDHFKDVNDRFGHVVGDRVLCAIAGALSEACGDHFVARHGGEEFAILFDGPVDDAVAVIDQARRSIGRKRFRLRESDVLVGTVTFSAGVSLAGSAEPLAKVFERADALLYAAKASGRDCIFADGDVSI